MKNNLLASDAKQKEPQFNARTAKKHFMDLNAPECTLFSSVMMKTTKFSISVSSVVIHKIGKTGSLNWLTKRLRDRNSSEKGFSTRNLI